MPTPLATFAYALAAYVAIAVARAHEVVPFLSVLKPAKLSLLVVILILAVRPRQLPWKLVASSTVTMFMIGTFVLALLSIPGAVWPGGSASYVLTVYVQTFLVFALVAAGFVHRRTLWLGLQVFVLGALGAAVLSFLVPPGRTGRFGIGSTYDANDTAAFLVIALPFFFLMATEGRWMRKVALIGVPVVLAAIVKTGSRGGIIALALMTPFLLFYAPPRRRSLYVGLVGVCALVLSVTMPPALRHRFATLFDQTDYNFSDRDGRKAVLKRGIGYMVTNPVLGVGIAGFPYAEGASKRNEGFGVKFMNAHNSYVQIGAELGVGGLLCFLGAIGGSWMGCRRVRKRMLAAPVESPTAKREVGTATAALCALVGLCGAALFLSTAYNPVTYFIFALCTAIAVGAPLLGAPAPAVVSSSRPRVASSVPGPAVSSAPAAQPRRGRGWTNAGRTRQAGPTRWRGGLKR